MIRKIIHIDQEKCNGCGACASACHEGAIGMVDGKEVPDPTNTDRVEENGHTVCIKTVR